jgi:hypothetical protein
VTLATWKNAVLVATPLAILGFWLAACDMDPAITPVDGVVVVDPNPDDISASWVLTGPGDFRVDGQGDQSIDNLLPGDYSLTWGDVQGYGTPDARTGTLSDSAVLTFRDTYVAREVPRGTVTIDLEPEDMGGYWVLIYYEDTTHYVGYSDSTLTDLPVGEYTLGWGAVPAWSSPTPNPAVQTLEQDATIHFAGTYEEMTSQPLGTVVINPDPNQLDAPWTLRGPGGFFATGFGDDELEGRAIGEYTLTWGNVPGYRTPAPSTLSLAADQTIEFAATYEVGTGTIRIDPNPDSIDAPWTLVETGGVTRNGNGDTVLSDITSGQYTLTWGSVSGWITPEPRSQTLFLSVDDSRVLMGTYELPPPATGTLMINVTPEEASWTCTGPGFNTSGAGDRTFRDIPTGQYTVVWNDVNGWTLPAPGQTTKEVRENETVTFSVAYTREGAPTIDSVSGDTSQGGTLQIDGSGFAGHTMDVEWTGSWIESQPVGTNPDQKQGWDHVYSFHGQTDHISTAKAWSGTKSIDASIDQDATDSWMSGLSYVSDPFEKIYVSYWIWATPIRSSSGPESEMGAKHVSVTCYNCNTGAVLNSSQNQWQATFTFAKSNGVLTKWDIQGAAFTRCPGSPEPFIIWDQAEGVGYELPPQNYLRPKIRRDENEYSTEYGVRPNEWTRLAFYLDGGTPDTYDGEVYIQAIHPGESQSIGLWARNVLMRTARTDCNNFPEPWQRFTFYLFYDQPNDTPGGEVCEYFLDDAYIQFGTRARVELGNASGYEACTVLEVQDLVSWNDDGISIRFNRGRFQPGEEVYLFVVRDDEVPSSGHRIVLD